LMMRFPADGSVPETVHAVAQKISLSVVEVIDIETESLEAMGSHDGTKRWRFA
jgi:DNA-directed RNA polymerase sigma subunit (sigma70/sigma32)